MSRWDVLRRGTLAGGSPMRRYTPHGFGFFRMNREYNIRVNVSILNQNFCLLIHM